MAAPTPSAANEGEDVVERMMTMTAGPAVPAAELTVLLATAALAHRPAVSITKGLTPVSSTATTSTAPSTTSAPPPPPSL